ncbi:hypothetical protein [Desulfoluna butyratoxydans]|uniref:Uncharacterized protein n=1 Tax=Desulfoluna butyratoxydans TaxID=231438 RepID=A0A4U8YJU1_9BACT|nr:hypothetical protein [Desulfoluna butyratoxydans]VFQ43710.1 hypothetical protein MSL71_13510 [Desulfoluna butyratoxydans]
MDQKYVVDKDLEAGTLTLKEMAETDVGKFSVLHQESFPLEVVEAALPGGADALIAMFRNHDFFPPAFSANTLAEGILSMFGADEKTTVKIAFCDNDALESAQEEPQEALVTDEKELVEIDKLLDDTDETHPPEVEP